NLPPRNVSGPRRNDSCLSSRRGRPRRPNTTYVELASDRPVYRRDGTALVPSCFSRSHKQVHYALIAHEVVMPSFPLEVRLDGRFGPNGPPLLQPPPPGHRLPEPVFPQHPEFLTDEPWPGDGERHWPASKILHALRGWAVPFVKSRILPGDFH